MYLVLVHISEVIVSARQFTKEIKLLIGKVTETKEYSCFS